MTGGLMQLVASGRINEDYMNFMKNKPNLEFKLKKHKITNVVHQFEKVTKCLINNKCVNRKDPYQVVNISYDPNLYIKPLYIISDMELEIEHPAHLAT